MPAVTRREAPRELGEVALEYLWLAADHPPPEMSVVRSHVMWMLGRSGKSHRVSFEHTGPFSSAQLRLALLDAETLGEFEALVRATLLGER